MHSCRAVLTWSALCALLWLAAGTATAHPLGNFSVNQLARVEPGQDRIAVHYVLDLAEIPAFQEIQLADRDGDGKAAQAELDAHFAAAAPGYADGLRLSVDGTVAPLRITSQRVELLPGAGGLSTLRLELDLETPFTAGDRTHRVRLRNENFAGRVGWVEMSVASSGDDVSVFDSSVLEGSPSAWLRTFPTEAIEAPLDERAGELSFVDGPAPAGSRRVELRGGLAQPKTADPFAKLIQESNLTPATIWLALLAAFVLGAGHALSPGHGKTLAAAYLVGTRARGSHAALLAIIVTVTHTAAVYGLGLITLGASQYIPTERLMPILTFLSGAMILVMGLRMLQQRLRVALELDPGSHDPHPHGAHSHHHHGDHDPAHGDDAFAREHGHALEDHLPPGLNGTQVTWRSLLAFGVSGGMVPCPTALVVMLSAIALERIAYGLALITVFSFGLATTLTAVGILVVYAGHWLERMPAPGMLSRLVPIGSAMVITGIGFVICYQEIVRELV